MKRRGCCLSVLRASNGQRTYTDDDIATLSIIEYLKFCGLPLKEIRSFLPLIRPGGETLAAPAATSLPKSATTSARRSRRCKRSSNVWNSAAGIYETAQQYGSVLPLYEFSEEHFPPEHRNVLRESFHLPLTHVRTKLEW